MTNKHTFYGCSTFSFLTSETGNTTNTRFLFRKNSDCWIRGPDQPHHLLGPNSTHQLVRPILAQQGIRKNEKIIKWLQFLLSCHVVQGRDSFRRSSTRKFSGKAEVDTRSRHLSDIISDQSLLINLPKSMGMSLPNKVTTTTTRLSSERTLQNVDRDLIC